MLFFLKQKGKCDQKDWSGFSHFVINIPCSETYILEVGAPVSLKVAHKGSLRGKKIMKIYCE